VVLRSLRLVGLILVTARRTVARLVRPAFLLRPVLRVVPRSLLLVGLILVTARRTVPRPARLAVP
jgi:hypothetical protein